MRQALLFSFFAAFFLAAGAPLFAQAERMSEGDYNTALAKALDAASSRDRRVLMEEGFYTGAQATLWRRITSDFVGKEAKRIEAVEESNGKITRSSSITLNGQFFCKDGKKTSWERADKECAKAARMLAIPDGEYEYFVGDDPNHGGRKVYTRRAIYIDSGSPERDAVRLKSIEIKFVTDGSGLILEYVDERRGGVQPNGWSSTHVTQYIYEPADLKITDPTKGH